LPFVEPHAPSQAASLGLPSNRVLHRHLLVQEQCHQAAEVEDSGVEGKSFLSVGKVSSPAETFQVNNRPIAVAPGLEYQSDLNHYRSGSGNSKVG